MWVPHYQDFWALFTFSFLTARLADLGKKSIICCFCCTCFFAQWKKRTFGGMILLICFAHEEENILKSRLN